MTDELEADKPALGARDYAERWARDTLSGRAEGGRFPWGQRNIACAFLGARTELAALRAERDALAEALRWFLEDERFQVAVGGNPNVVERMLASARAILASLNPKEQQE